MVMEWLTDIGFRYDIEGDKAIPCVMDIVTVTDDMFE